MTTEVRQLSAEGKHLASLIDHTYLKQDGTARDVERLCEEAKLYGFCAVCVLPALLPVAVACLKGSPVIPCTVAGFPLGAATTASKAFEAGEAAATGAREVDMVLAVWAIRDRQYNLAQADISAVVKAVGHGCGVKVIFETCLLSDEEKITACRLAVDAGARFVKTSTGLAGGGATVADVRLMRTAVGPGTGVKASGGIRTRGMALAMVQAGANRIGTSAGISIVTES
jgi:deoxyribose-phosphate aldolase